MCEGHFCRGHGGIPYPAMLKLSYPVMLRLNCWWGHMHYDTLPLAEV